ncbi:hypothetical protein [Acidovorax sp. PRC11]|uniref:hypothetical protein n=1 Tax=Acidovorax sp. PRC11 TaxID=2962592 RepID=UPI00288207D1|nr:hypothetical protein [Acidovorax sp. PRC11]MDT0140395.1 hypothetical protein [Acidovorax sp. PRC11]
MSRRFIPQEIRPADQEQQRLTERHLQGRLAEVEHYLYAVRREIDQELPGCIPTYRKPYPYGCCLEISEAFERKLRAAVASDAGLPGLDAIRAFMQEGGHVGSVWGALRERYFQNAFQFGSLYVDVSNDTVDVRKPAIEILPMAESGLLNVSDVAHFVRIARAYWEGEYYVNDVWPALAPIAPVVMVVPDLQLVRFPTGSAYMVGLQRRDRYQAAEAYIAEGPALPATAREALLARLAPRRKVADARQGRALARAACASLRRATPLEETMWLNRQCVEWSAFNRTA